MPVRITQTPFSAQPKERAEPRPKQERKPRGTGLREPHARVLRAMLPADHADQWFDWPVFSRGRLRVACGMSESNSMNRILHGVKDGPSAHQGMLGLGLIEELKLDVEGTTEYNYRITAKGIECLSLHDGDHK